MNIDQIAFGGFYGPPAPPPGGYASDPVGAARWRARAIELSAEIVIVGDERPAHEPLGGAHCPDCGEVGPLSGLGYRVCVRCMHSYREECAS